MALRRLLLSCFGGDNNKAPVVVGIEKEFEPSESISVSPKYEKSYIRSQSSSSIESVQISKRRSTTRALCVVAKHTYGLASDIPYPSIDTPDEIIIRTVATSLNPIDYKSVDYNFCMPSFPWIGGREVAGTVEEVGSNVTEFKVGDHVWASTYYRDRRAGTFQEFCVVPQHTVLPLPTRLDFNAGACLGVAALTAAMTLWKWLAVEMPSARPKTAATPPRHILIWGGSTVTGQFAIQFANRSGLSVIAVTSAKTRCLAERLGAANVITRDHKTNDEIVAEIRAITGDDLTMAIDIVGNTTGSSCLQALSATKASTLAPLAFLKDGEQIPENVTIAPIEMKRFIIEEGNRKYAEELNRLVGDGSVSIPEIEVLHGLEMVQEGLEMLKRGDMNGRKLVVRVA
ncbi:hypothetical protein LTR56_003401 [Elasticomyces elasticus]|nr:hypothetical protein LTR56_003401 [Elasticomyces elasticus]KAK3664180.1 hypothetical protein LTR22_004878 [Elasticomyces elasticus]KAK4931395.1 hypothetical protein LTR49_002096 [Elasticomyces elasticus]KAK5766085.1 hypothetical protein LTS12_003831 [Elasticomyces elasticus]